LCAKNYERRFKLLSVTEESLLAAYTGGTLRVLCVTVDLMLEELQLQQQMLDAQLKRERGKKRAEKLAEKRASETSAEVKLRQDEAAIKIPYMKRVVVSKSGKTFDRPQKRPM